MRVHRMIKKYYIALRETPSKYEYNVSCGCIYNLHEIRMLRIEYETMPFLLQEGRLQRARGACSRTKKGLFSAHARTPFRM